MTRWWGRVLLKRGPLRITMADAALAVTMAAIGGSEVIFEWVDVALSAQGVVVATAGAVLAMLLRSSMVELSVVIVQLTLPFWVMSSGAVSWSALQMSAYLVSSYSIGALRPLRRATLIQGLVVAVYVLSATAQGAGPGEGVGSALIATFAWATGVFVHRRSEERDLALERARTLEREQELRARATIAEERTRLARDLHDALGHQVTVMVMHAGAVRRLLRPDQEQERTALAEVEQVGRDAVVELHRLVAALREDEVAEPRVPAGLALVPDLVARARAVGADVTVELDGATDALPPSVDAAAYSVVQEAFTNALRHAPGSAVRICVKRYASSVDVEVTDDGPGSAPPAQFGPGGHGLLGMRERVSLLGGQVTAGSRSGRPGWQVVASLPIVAS
jgi:signal transduction histidine kinase